MSAMDALGWEEEQVALATLTSTSTSIDFSHGNDDDEVSNMDTDSGHDSDSDFDNDSSNGEAEEDEEEDSPFNVAEYSPIKREEILKTPIISTSNANINKRGDRDCRKSHQSNVNIHIDSGDSNNDNNSGKNNINTNNDNNRYPLSHLKPFFDVGTAVYGPWWQGERQIFCDTWYPGKVASYKEYPSSSPYGPRRKYTIHYDDGDKLEDVEDHYVFSKEDYLVLFRKGVGYRCELDTRYAGDLWASLVGYYVVTLDGVDVKFARLVGTSLLDTFSVFISLSRVHLITMQLVVSSFSLCQMPWMPTITMSFNKRERASESRISIDQRNFQSCLHPHRQQQQQQQPNHRNVHHRQGNLDPVLHLNFHRRCRYHLHLQQQQQP